MFKYIIIIFLLLLTPSLQAQMYWQRPVANFNRHTYNAASQNWNIEQDSNGWMYFANNKGLLEFDGVYWNLYALPHLAKMRSLKINSDKRIYVGAQKEFGYFSTNRIGGLDYHSLSSGLNPQIVSNIWNIHIIDNRIYFQGDRYIFCYENSKIIPIDCNGVSCSGPVKNKLYFSNRQGISYIINKKIVHIPNSSFLNKNKIVEFLPYKGKLLIITQEHGTYLYDGKVFSRPFTTIDNHLFQHHVTCTHICNDLLAIGTSGDGLLLINIKTQQIEKIGIENGLQNKSILSLRFNKEKNLWLGLDNGIDYVSLNTQLYFLNSKLSSIGAGYCSSVYRNNLYLGTNQGLFTMSMPNAINVPINLHALSNMTGQVHCIYQHDGKLFCGGRSFFGIIDGNQTEMFNKRGVWHVQSCSLDSNIMLIGTYWGLEVMRKIGGKWVVTNNIPKVNLSAKTMYLVPKSNQVWIANKSDGVWKITLNSKYTKVLRQKNYNNQQLPKGDNVYITQIGYDLIIASRKGLFRYNTEKDILQRDEHLEQILDGHCAYTYIKEDSFGNIWYVANGILKCYNQQQHTKHSFWNDAMIEDFEDVFSANSYQFFIGTEDGFALLNTSKHETVKDKLSLFIRKIYTTNGKDSIIFSNRLVHGNNERVIEMKYKDNSFRIEYGCNNFCPTKAISYSFILEGFDKSWSKYTSSTKKEYTDLPEGDYIFKVKIRPDSHDKDIITSIRIKVLPPWYRSWWAYVFYIVVIASSVYYSYLRYKKGRKRLIQLKDAEMSRQKYVLEKDIDQKQKQISKLEEEKLRNELNYKSDELIKTTLNVVRKNEILQKIKKDAENLSRTINEGNLVSIRRGMLRLINQIDTNMEHDGDLDNFQSSFNAVHDDFFKKLDTKYPQLTYKDKMLCAYIKMNLMSKEIAPLLSISVRGVEINRYRLRKKLGLDEKANLAEFLQKI